MKTLYITLIILNGIIFASSQVTAIGFPDKELQTVTPSTTFSHDQCQYPDRLTNPPDGCDNTDPACPELAKGDATCPSDIPIQENQPVQQGPDPTVTPLPYSDTVETK